MPVIKVYRVEYTFKQPRHKDEIFIVNNRVIADSKSHALREGLADSLILMHLISHSIKLIERRVTEL